MAMARDGLLPKFFSRVNKTTKVPVNGTLISGLAASIMAFSMDVDQLAGMVQILLQLRLWIRAVLWLTRPLQWKFYIVDLFF